MERARKIGRVTLLDACDEETLVRAVGDCHALLVRTQSQVTRRVIESARQMRVIGRGGSGVDHIDVQAAFERGIEIVHTPDAATEAVADLTMGLMLGVVRGMIAGDAAVRAGAEPFSQARSQCIGPELRELTLGIVGMGRIGRAVGRRARNGFDMRVCFHDIAKVGLLDFVAQSVDLDALLDQSDIVSLHVPLTDRTRQMIDTQALKKFKPGAMLINTSRGAVVDSDALADALSRGTLCGAGLDVFDPEPLPAGHPLLKSPNTLFTPHLGARTHHTQAAMNDVVDDVLGVLQGRNPQHPVPRPAEES